MKITPKQFAEDLMEFFTPAGKINQGKIDVTEHLSLREIAEDAGFSKEENDELVEECQKIADLKVKEYLDRVAV